MHVLGHVIGACKGAAISPKYCRKLLRYLVFVMDPFLPKDNQFELY